MPKDIFTYLGPLLIVAIVAWRMSRSMKGRPVKPSRLWIRPALIGVLMAAAMAGSTLPSLFGVGLFVLAAAAGVGLGYLLARHQAFTLDPVNGTITARTSPFGVILFVLLFAGRFYFNTVVRGGQAPGKLMAHSAQITLYTDVGLIFLLALVSAQAWEIWRRTRPLVAEHAARTAKAAGEAAPE